MLRPILPRYHGDAWKEGVQLPGSTLSFLGRSDIVGKPVAHLLNRANATVTTVHSRLLRIKLSSSWSKLTLWLLFRYRHQRWMAKRSCCHWRGNQFHSDLLKSGSRWLETVISSHHSRRSLEITPVPSGVGPLTVASLLEAMIHAAKEHYSAQQPDSSNSPTHWVNLQTPVPVATEISFITT